MPLRVETARCRHRVSFRRTEVPSSSMPGNSRNVGYRCARSPLPARHRSPSAARGATMDDRRPLHRAGRRARASPLELQQVTALPQDAAGGIGTRTLTCSHGASFTAAIVTPRPQRPPGGSQRPRAGRTTTPVRSFRSRSPLPGTDPRSPESARARVAGPSAVRASARSPCRAASPIPATSSRSEGTDFSRGSGIRLTPSATSVESNAYVMCNVAVDVRRSGKSERRIGGSGSASGTSSGTSSRCGLRGSSVRHHRSKCRVDVIAAGIRSGRTPRAHRRWPASHGGAGSIQHAQHAARLLVAYHECVWE